MENIRTVGQLILALNKLNPNSPLVDVGEEMSVVTIEEIELEDLDIKGCHIEIISQDDVDHFNESEYDYEDEEFDSESDSFNDNNDYFEGFKHNTDIDEDD